MAGHAALKLRMYIIINWHHFNLATVMKFAKPPRLSNILVIQYAGIISLALVAFLFDKANSYVHWVAYHLLRRILYTYHTCVLFVIGELCV